MKEWILHVCLTWFFSIVPMSLTAVAVIFGYYGYAICWGIITVPFVWLAVDVSRSRKLYVDLEEFDKRKTQVWNDILTNDSIDEATRARQIQTMIGIEERTSGTR